LPARANFHNQKIVEYLPDGASIASDRPAKAASRRASDGNGLGINQSAPSDQYLRDRAAAGWEKVSAVQTSCPSLTTVPAKKQRSSWIF
jgi:hypothetical protein